MNIIALHRLAVMITTSFMTISLLLIQCEFHRVSKVFRDHETHCFMLIHTDSRCVMAMKQSFHPDSLFNYFMTMKQTVLLLIHLLTEHPFLLDFALEFEIETKIHIHKEFYTFLKQGRYQVALVCCGGLRGVTMIRSIFPTLAGVAKRLKGLSFS